MTTSLSDFSSEIQLGATESTLVSTNSSEKKFIGKSTFTNTSSSNVELTVWRIGSATIGVVGSGGNWIDKASIPAGKTYTCYKIMGHVLGNSMKISALASTTNVINADLSGTTEV